MSASPHALAAIATSVFEGWLSGFRMVSGGVGCCRGGVWWCRVVSGLEVSGRCQGLSGLSVCEDACTRARAVGAVGLSGFGCCRVVSDCRGCVGESSLTLWCQLASRFDLDNSKQSVEESNPNMHTLKHMRLKISLTPRSSVRLRPFKARNWPKKAL